MPQPNSVVARPSVVFALISGVLMTVYLTLRPYGDVGGSATLAAAEAFASPLWIASHLAGATSLVALAALWAQVSTRWPRWAAIVGVAMVLPYYGAETFALHEIGARALAGDTGVLDLVVAVRDHPVAMTLFGIGLVALAVAGIGAALWWRRDSAQMRAGDRGKLLPGGALVPLAVVAALFLSQFFLPPAGRMVYGVVFAVAAVYAAMGLSGAMSAENAKERSLSGR